VSVYGDSVSWEVSEYSRLDISRAGSVFVNANMYAQFILLFLAISLAIDQNKRDNVAYALMSWTLIATSLLLAGSRTGTVIAALLVVSSMVRRVLTTRGKARKTSLLPLVILSVTAAVGSVVYLSARQADSARFRAFQVTAGVDNSLAYKVNTFHNMVGRFNALNACVGMGVMETDTKYITKIDFDLGYLIVFYGTAGCILYMCMLYDICCYRNNMPARYVYLNRLITFIFVASGITAGVFFNLRVFSIVAAVVYADVLDAEFQPIRVPCLNGTSPRSGSRQRLYGTRTFGEM